MAEINNHRAFMPIRIEGIGLGTRSVRHLRHRDQLPPSAPRQGASYFDIER